MASNSVRISADLFLRAKEEGELLSRSIAQQIEHWARLGAALQDAGITADDAKELLSMRTRGAVRTESAESIWRYKREGQARDIAALKAGRLTNDQTSWFTEQKAQRATILGAPY